MKKILCFFKETLLSRGPGIYKRADHLCAARPYFYIVYHMSARIPYPETKKAPETLNCYLKNRWDIPPAPHLHRVHRVRHLLHVISHRAGGIRSMLRDELDDRGADDVRERHACEEANAYSSMKFLSICVPFMYWFVRL